MKFEFCLEYGVKVTNAHLSLMEWIENGEEKKVRIYDESSHKWHQIGETLGFDNGVLEGIGQDGHNVRDRVTKVLGIWYENACGLPHSDQYPMTWRGMINILNKSGLKELAKKVHTALLHQTRSRKYE